MALIKCPKCGQQISDKAPACPNCGVKILDNITKCENCGEVYLKDEDQCPHCSNNKEVSKEPDTTKKKKNNLPYILVSLAIACAICGIAYYMYSDAKSSKENEEYQYAIQSKDSLVLRSYLDTFKDAPKAHRDSIEARLQMVKSGDREWLNAVVSNSASIIEAYIKNNPNSPHQQEALHLIDSLEWEIAKNKDTEEAYKEYLAKHYDGEHYEEANDNMKAAKAKNVTSEERMDISDLFHKFFVSINTRDEYGLTSTVADEMKLLDKTSANKNDVVAFMHKMYKDDVKSMVWRLDKNYTIGKREVGDGLYEYSVSFTAVQDIKRDNDGSIKKYRINATVNQDKLISEFTMSRLANDE